MEAIVNCPNCNTKLKGLLNSLNLLSESEVKFAQDFGGFKGKMLCDKCGKPILKKAKEKYISENGRISNFLNNYVSTFPIITLQTPSDWRYETLGIVTAQATMDNRVQNKSLFQTILGINQNLIDLDGSVNIGESICFNILRQKAHLLGGNAVLGVDIDYSEFGLKGELMLVCTAGTAVNVIELESMSERYASLNNQFNELKSNISKLQEHSGQIKNNS